MAYNPKRERDLVIPMPSSADSQYHRVLLLGTTGAGKTTLLRQILGTDPETERFPSTSAAKTTIADTEIILGGDTYRAVVTFAPIDEVKAAIEDCVIAATGAAYEEKADADIQRKLLNHVDQRYRFSYVLGNPPTDEDDDDIEDEDDEVVSPPLLQDNSGSLDLEKTHGLIASCVTKVKELARKHRETISSELSASASEENVVDELFIEELGSLLGNDPDFHQMRDDLINEIKLRFTLLQEGELSEQEWPQTWRWETTDRRQFIRQVTRFTSNYAPLFGRLLTPLVNGIRVKGPFQPDWLTGDSPELVLVDGEGLGHTPNSASSLPAKTQESFNEMDVILLVDNAIQPMQASTIAALRAVISSGNASKLHIVFTHFDGVVGDNLRTVGQKKDHVKASVESVIERNIRTQLGQTSAEVLEERLDSATFFVGGIDKRINSTSGRGQRTIQSLSDMLDAVRRFSQIEPGTAIPVYKLSDISPAIRSGVEAFEEDWNARLGLGYSPWADKEHWARIKALNRRFAERWDPEEYSALRPIADLAMHLRERMWDYIQKPLYWRGEASKEEQNRRKELFADSISLGFLRLARRRLSNERICEWEDAYELYGTGSTRDRAVLISDCIFNISDEYTQLIKDIEAIVTELADDMGIELIQ